MDLLRNATIDARANGGEGKPDLRADDVAMQRIHGRVVKDKYVRVAIDEEEEGEEGDGSDGSDDELEDLASESGGGSVGSRGQGRGPAGGGAEEDGEEIFAQHFDDGEDGQEGRGGAAAKAEAEPEPEPESELEDEEDEWDYLPTEDVDDVD